MQEGLSNFFSLLSCRDELSFHGKLTWLYERPRYENNPMYVHKQRRLKEKSRRALLDRFRN